MVTKAFWMNRSVLDSVHVHKSTVSTMEDSNTVPICEMTVENAHDTQRKLTSHTTPTQPTHVRPIGQQAAEAKRYITTNVTV